MKLQLDPSPITEMGSDYFKTLQEIAQQNTAIGALSYVIGGFFLFAFIAGGFYFYFKYIERKDEKVRKKERREHESAVESKLDSISSGVVAAAAERKVMEGDIRRNKEDADTRMDRIEKTSDGFSKQISDLIKVVREEFMPSFHTYKADTDSRVRELGNRMGRLEQDHITHKENTENSIQSINNKLHD